MAKSYNVVFYSKCHNVILAKDIKDLMAKKGCGVINIDDISTIFLNKELKIKYLILDFTASVLERSLLSVLEKMCLEGLIDKIIIISNGEKNFSETFYTIKNNEKLIVNLNNLFSVFLREDEKNLGISMGSWRRIICEKLLEWDFPLKQNGTMLIIEGIVYYIGRNAMIKNLDKEFYEYASKKYQISKYSVELNIRKSLNVANGSDKFPSKAHMTNKSFLMFAVSFFYDLLTSVTLAS